MYEFDSEYSILSALPASHCYLQYQLEQRPFSGEGFQQCICSGLGVYNALQKKYLETLLFCVCEVVEARTNDRNTHVRLNEK
ncbi:hypothetical protein RchiOBHm_Chr4g0429901 [Rosa chinensis]|uniref:Uncharacterized protein n=1 Tax=Rosa chinensis TaxID=74649 RepID=A0A2P6R0A3_ROSCH|nr:hypothetical protein RchiOBHm_Chr4g0429901 [Rosa chinensis]